MLVNGKLHLGPFQGKVACTPIKLTDGVCGHAFTTKKLTNVPNVHEFEGHIACDEMSKSELVIPLIKDGKAFGVLDVDSPIYDRFDVKTTKLINEIAKVIVKYYII